jgi:hypothetical protein
MWAVATSENHSPFRLYIIAGQPVLFFIGALPLLYYLRFLEKFEGDKQPVHFGSAQLSISIKYADILVYTQYY